MGESPFSHSIVSEVTLPGGLQQRLEGLIVLVGPNSSGKTTLLREVHAAATGQGRRLVVSSAVSYRPAAAFEGWIAHLQETGDVELVQDGMYRQLGQEYGGGGGGAGSQRADIDMRRAHAAFAQSPRRQKNLGPDTWLQFAGSLECSALFLENRLQVTGSTGSFDPENTPPSNTLQALALNREAQRRLESEVGRTFGRGLWFDSSRLHYFALRVSHQPDVPSLEEQRDFRQMKRYETIETAGEGLRSYVAVCVTLLLGRRPLCVIDEPEMCLHPPQARALGRFIGMHAAEHGGSVIVATHSSHMLRGILEGAKTVRVIRLTRNEGNFGARVVAPDVLRQATSKPHARTEAVLDGLFSQGVVVCEGEGDRVVYESAAETLEPRFSDVRFVPVGGIGGFRSAIRLYGQLGVPVAAIADLDAIDKEEVWHLLEDLAPADAAALRERLVRCRDQLRQLRTDPPPDDVIRRLRDLTSSEANWSSDQAQKLRSELSRLATRLNKLSWMKESGLATLDAKIRALTETLLSDFGKVGMFLVPVGELESWVPTLMADIPRSNKAAWATLAGQRIEEHGQETGDIWGFVREVTDYLRHAGKLPISLFDSSGSGASARAP